ncbi:MAG: L-rhamnose/proton symporter RhaT [Terriglobia bacterium]
MSSLSIGIMLAIIAGIMNGSFASPTKYVKVWKWENIWAVWGVMGMVVFPWLVVFLTIPNAGTVYQSVGARNLLLMIGFGVGFGLAQIFFGLGIAAIGIALNFAIAIGLSTALGSIVPLLVLQRQKIFTAQGGLIFLGVGLILVGIVGCAVAGGLKEKHLASSAARPRESTAVTMSFKAGLFICILAGLGSPLINFGLAFGAPLLTAAAAQGVGPSSRANVIWAPLNTAALIPYLIYCAYLWKKNHTASLFRAPGTGLNWVLGAVMGLLWFWSTVIYGGVSARLSEMGPILGWPLFMSAIIITSNVVGLLTGEWKGSGSKALGAMLAGIVFLIGGFATLALASRLG